MRRCDEFLDKERREDGRLLKDVCDCMLVKVVAAYTPKQADTLDISQNRELLEGCHYFEE